MDCYVKKQFALDATSWTPIIAPVDCDMFWFKNIGDGLVTLLRTNVGDPTTEDRLYAGYQETLSFPWQATTPTQPPRRFPVGSVIVYAKPDTGVGPLVVTFVQ